MSEPPTFQEKAVDFGVCQSLIKHSRLLLLQSSASNLAHPTKFLIYFMTTF